MSLKVHSETVALKMIIGLGYQIKRRINRRIVHNRNHNNDMLNPKRSQKRNHHCLRESLVRPDKQRTLDQESWPIDSVKGGHLEYASLWDCLDV